MTSKTEAENLFDQIFDVVYQIELKQLAAATAENFEDIALPLMIKMGEFYGAQLRDNNVDFIRPLAHTSLRISEMRRNLTK